ncbi:MAG: hypothetical protein COU31_04325 [Candidatus Magasanikbacteria bacterium CG10_big_fil_rev_8_21_14_0_10_40_10]|uniref:Uncharacterized protein n=1 Tax=Candidatus Magasanikbacteria bacterium CG10_big_fil_rev_8_21_14_0_10_40_10 TaxID=1974648 RepID=A0A2M6W2Y9_9BACT|nr:MAG: hypothetical protein COU31_04325 [Candidatus Magasanikbacteria bacterium CG10_big_fil_rev_8_21_14_0_10_40_10]
MQNLNNEITTLEMQLKKLNGKSENEESTLELCKKHFLTAIKAKKEFENAHDCKKRGVLKKVLLNLFIQGKDLASFKLKDPYQSMIEVSKNCSFVELSG